MSLPPGSLLDVPNVIRSSFCILSRHSLTAVSPFSAFLRFIVNAGLALHISHQLCGFLLAQTVKNLPAMQEHQVGSLGWGRSSGEGNGNSLECSCLENPTDRGV